jgi:hypothetical protein
LITQLLRNRLSESNELHRNIASIENEVRRNLRRTEPEIIAQICNVWNGFDDVDLEPFTISGVNYSIWLEFQLVRTHQNYIDISSEEFTSNNKQYRTEFGDLAFLIDYYLDGVIISRKTSILQSKIDSNIDSVDIALHQLFLMRYWPNVTYSGNTYSFEGVYPDVFSFYHFILGNTHSPRIYSTVCSAEYVGLNTNLSRGELTRRLSDWLILRENNPRQAPPSIRVNMTLNPHNIPRRIWKLTPKPFTRMIKELAYQFWGTSDRRILQLARDRISNFIRLKVVAGRNKSDLLEKRDDDFIFEL